MSLCRSLHNNGGVGAAFTYVLEHMHPDLEGLAPHWHVTSEFLRRQRACWQRWNGAANQLQPLSVVG